MKQLLTFFLRALVRAYQLVLSPIMGQNCRFYPSCSAYTLEALELHGPFKGSWLGLKRIIRCHPGSKGGIDPVPGTESYYETDQELVCDHNSDTQKRD